MWYAIVRRLGIVMRSEFFPTRGAAEHYAARLREWGYVVTVALATAERQAVARARSQSRKRILRRSHA